MGVVLPNFRLTFSAVCAILPLSAQLLLWGFADAAYPREGTVTERDSVHKAGVQDAAYPREGTVTA